MSHNAVESDMDWRFQQGHWAAAGGNLQSLVFYEAMWRRVRPLLGDKIPSHWHDYGCAEGDGVAYLWTQLPETHFVGFDLSPHAIGTALRRWRGIEFDVGDVTQPEQRATVISTLHTLEHVESPVDALRRLKELASMVIAVTPPVTPEENGGHTGMNSEEYKALVMQDWPDAYITEYRTRRPDLWNAGAVMNEGNILVVI